MQVCNKHPKVCRRIADGEFEPMILAVHIDDNLAAGGKKEGDGLLAKLNDKFPTNDLGELMGYESCTWQKHLKAGTKDVAHRIHLSVSG